MFKFIIFLGVLLWQLLQVIGAYNTAVSTYTKIKNSRRISNIKVYVIIVGSLLFKEAIIKKTDNELILLVKYI